MPTLNNRRRNDNCTILEFIDQLFLLGHYLILSSKVPIDKLSTYMFAIELGIFFVISS